MSYNNPNQLESDMIDKEFAEFIVKILLKFPT